MHDCCIDFHCMKPYKMKVPNYALFSIMYIASDISCLPMKEIVHCIIMQ